MSHGERGSRDEMESLLAKQSEDQENATLSRMVSFQPCKLDLFCYLRLKRLTFIVNSSIQIMWRKLYQAMAFNFSHWFPVSNLAVTLGGHHYF